MNDKLYDPKFIASLFDEMSKTYGTVNTISSFGFCVRWRKQCANLIGYEKGDHVVDLMSGMSELSIVIDRTKRQDCQFTCIDLSQAMCDLANQSVTRLSRDNIQIVHGDALNTNLDTNSVTAVVSTFGLKTFSDDQLRQLAQEIHRILRPGGRIAFLEISVPRFWLLRVTYMFYVSWLIPVIGRIFMGNPENYRLLGVYTNKFQNCDNAIEHFRSVGLEIVPQRFFFGCATGFSGTKPA